jgi:hypothetical protein
MMASAAVASTNCPRPEVLSRWTSAAMMPMAAALPPTWSATHMPERVGRPPNSLGSPVPWTKPEAAWATGSRIPGRSLRGPHWPRWPTHAYTSRGFSFESWR